MSVMSANGVDILEAVVQMPISGAWHADLVIDTYSARGFAAGDKLTLTTPDGLFSVVGSVRRSGVYQNVLRARVVAGAGGLAKTAVPKFYRTSPIKLPLSDLLGAAGETLSATTDSDVIQTRLESWTVVQQQIGSAVSLLVEEAGDDVTWRFLADGSFWCGRDTWPSVDSRFVFDLVNQRPHLGWGEYRVASPQIMPGCTTDDGRVSYVKHVVVPDSVRSFLWFQDA